LTRASNEGSRYGTRKSISCGISLVNCSFSESYTSLAIAASFSVCGH
jgi:hypothetical protein